MEFYNVTVSHRSDDSFIFFHSFYFLCQRKRNIKRKKKKEELGFGLIRFKEKSCF